MLGKMMTKIKLGKHGTVVSGLSFTSVGIRFTGFSTHYYLA